MYPAIAEGTEFHQKDLVIHSFTDGLIVGRVQHLNVTPDAGT